MTIHYNTVYPSEEKMDTVALTAYRFGYTMQESMRISKQVRINLDNYARQYDMAQERMRRLADRSVQNPTQTPYWKARNG